MLDLAKRLRLILWVLLRSLRMRLFANILSVLAVLLGVGLALVVPLSLRAFQQGASDAAQIFDLLVTAEGSQTQAVLSTIYYQDAPLDNIPYRVYAALRDDGRTERAVPLGFGDNVQGYPLVGTTLAYFELRPSPQAPPYFGLEQGTLFSKSYEVVLGAQVARETGFALGDTLETAHGFVETFEPTLHTQDYRVVGILQPTGGPSDRAVYTSIESVWDAHGQFSPEQEGEVTIESLADPPPEDDARQVTAVLYASADLAALYQVAGKLDGLPGVQAVFPGNVINGLLSLLGQGQQTYGLLANVILALAVITVALNTYGGAVQAQKSLAILRMVGVSRGVVAGSVLLEAALLSFAGIVLGVVAAYLGVVFVGQVVQAQTSLTLPAPELSRADLWRSLVLLPVAVFFALLPALRAVRKSPLESV